MIRTRASRAAILAVVALAFTGHGQAAAPAAIEAIPVAATAQVQARRLYPPGMLMFPMNVSPTCYVLNNFADPRDGGTRSHEGVDIIAKLGQAIYAVTDGIVEVRAVDYGTGSTAVTKSGNYVRVYLQDGSGMYTMYGHMSAFGPGIAAVAGTRVPVTMGQIIGYVGDTGNPGPGNYHLHFEYHPTGGAAVDPVPHLVIPGACTVYKKT